MVRVGDELWPDAVRCGGAHGLLRWEMYVHSWHNSACLLRLPRRLAQALYAIAVSQGEIEGLYKRFRALDRGHKVSNARLGSLDLAFALEVGCWGAAGCFYSRLQLSLYRVPATVCSAVWTLAELFHSLPARILVTLKD